MRQGIAIDVDWESAQGPLVEENTTASSIRVSVNDHVATRVDDRRSRSVRESIHVAAYPLAIWFASSWWRLRWEPLPMGREVSSSWNCSHDVAATGYGYLWPTMALFSDGESMTARCRATDRIDAEPIQYIGDFSATFPVRLFEQEVDKFIEVVVERLRVEGLPETDLEKLWGEILRERSSPEISAYRKIEAKLGYDPDEAPDGVVARLLSLAPSVGEAAVADIAPVCAGADPGAGIDDVIALANSHGLVGHIERSPTLLERIRERSLETDPPWERGHAAARVVRSEFGLNDDKVSDEMLQDILHLAERDFLRESVGRRPRLGLAIRDEEPGNLSFHFSGGAQTTKRFEAARFLADQLTTPASERWLPVTRVKTARQKFQRSFAAEFLCPIERLATYLERDFSEENIEEAAAHFSVSPVCVSSHLANNGYIRPTDVPACHSDRVA